MVLAASTTILDDVIAGSLIEPRDYQYRVCDKTIGYQNKGVKSVMINSPTGSGKTIMALLHAAAMQREHNIGVGWVAMRRNLLAQAARENMKMKIGLDHAEYMSMFDKNPATHDALGRKIELLVVDEAQHDAASSMGNLHNLIRPRWILGMTATPFRTDRIKLCFDKVVRDIGIQQLIGLGYLSQYHHYTIPEWTVDGVVGTYLRDPQRWGKSAFYWHKREDAIECCERLKAGGVATETVFGNDRDREKRLERFEDNETTALVNMAVLTEGWDSPALKTVFVRDSQKGPTIQMAGRVFRKYPQIDHKQVVQSKLTHWPMQRTAEPDESFVWMDDEWRSYKKSKNIAIVGSRAMLTLARTKTEMPKFITNKAKSGRVGEWGDRGFDGTSERDDANGAGGMWHHG